MNRCLSQISTAFIVLSIVTTGLLAQNKDDARDLYQDAQKMRYERKWINAINLLEIILDSYPGSKFEDDAKFWIGYCLERIPDQRHAAFSTYSELVENYPNSPWADDAVIKQINLAEQFVLEGKESYKTYLYEQIRKEQKDIQNRAAIALGRIGDKKALPVLQKMQNDEDYGTLARDLTAVLQIDRMPVSDEAEKVADRDRINIIYDAEDTEPVEEEETKILWFDTKHYKHYRSMLRKDDNWSEEELKDFAFWHILDPDAFEEYKSLSDEYDKKEWERKFWKRKDPTPTTSENEFEEEFSRRIEYTRENFSYFWNYLHFKYLPDQYLRLGWYHAPWDARGELYIKYGEPDTRMVYGWHREEWTYFRHGVDFIVRQYMTNIYGNAIHAGEMSIRKYSNWGDNEEAFSHLNPFSSRIQIGMSQWSTLDSYFQANYIYKNEMRYKHDYKADPIDDIELEIDEDFSEEVGKLIYRYQLPAAEFELIPTDAGFEIRYKEIYCVLDEDLREVARNEMTRSIGNIPDEDFTFEEKILLNLPEGNYTLYLRIEDLNAENLGIYSQDFNVSGS